MPIRHFLAAALVTISLAPSVAAQQPEQTPTQATSLTIYNQDFAVARTQVDLDLHPGLTEVTTTQVTSQLEPDSVVLRDPTGKHIFHIGEQNYDAGVISQESLLEKFEGKTIDFEVYRGQSASPQTVQGKIIRAAHPGISYQQSQYQQNQPLIEVNGELQFQLPGIPLFPASTDGLLLKPALRWQIDSEKAQKFSAELAYITYGLGWEATYNVVTSEGPAMTTNEKADVLGWVTVHNQTGTDFPRARIKLMAGDVAKIAPQGFNGGVRNKVLAMSQSVSVDAGVTQKAFDDFHLYDLNRTVSLRNGEIKQIQFIEATGVALARSYLYDGGAKGLQPIYSGNFNQNRAYGLNSGDSKVLIVQEIKNSEANHLGIPLPAGRIRLYRHDSDGQMEFVGESAINHTPAEDAIKITTGSAFDIKGSRRQTDFHVNQGERILDESFEVRITNQKPQPVNVAVVEHLYRGDNWQITAKTAGPGDGADSTGWKSLDYTKLDSQTIQFPLEIPAKGETTLHYSVRYTW